MGRLRTIGRRTLKGIGFFLLFVLTVVVGVLVWLHTDSGRGFVAGKIVETANNSLNGTVDIGRIEGSLTDRFTVHDVVVKDAQGDVVVRIAELLVDFSVTPLFSRTVSVDLLRTTGLEAHLVKDKDGVLNVAKLAKEEEDKQKGPPWTIDLEDIQIQDGLVTYVEPGTDKQEVEDIQLAAAFHSDAEGLSAKLDSLAARWVQQDLTVAAQGAVDKDDTATRIEGVKLVAGESRVEVPELVMDTAGALAMTGSFDASLARSDLARLPALEPLRADIEASGKFTHDELWQALVNIQAGQARMELHAQYDAELTTAEVKLDAKNVNPAGLWAGQPQGQLELAAAVKAQEIAAPTEGLDATFDVDLSGTVEGRNLGQIHTEGVIKDAVVDALVTIRGEPGHLDANGRVALGGDTPVIREGHVEARFENIEPYGKLAGLARARGTVSIDADVSGPTDAMTVDAKIRTQDLVVNDTRVASAHVTAHVENVPSAISGKAVVTATGVRQGDMTIGPVDAEVAFTDEGQRIAASFDVGRSKQLAAKGQVSVVRAPEKTTVNIEALQGSYQGVALRTNESQVVLGPGERIAVDDLRITSDLGKVRVDGTLPRPVAGRMPEAKLVVALEDVQLGELKRVAPDLLPLEGTVDANIQIDRDGRRTELAARVQADGVRFGDPLRGPLDATVEVAIRDRDLTLAMKLEGKQQGRVSLDVDTRTPLDALDAEQWKRFDPSDIRAVKLRIEDLRVGAALALAGQPPRFDGRLDVDMQAAEGLQTASVDVALQRGRIAMVPGATNAHVEARFDRGETTARLAVVHPTIGEISGSARASLGARRLHEVSPDRGIEDLEAAELTVHRLNLEPLSEALPNLPPLGGHLQAHAKLGAGARELTVKLDGDQLRTEQWAIPVNVNLEATGNDQEVSGRVMASVRRPDEAESLPEVFSTEDPEPLVTILQGEFTVGKGLAALRTGGGDALQTAEVRADLKVPALPLLLVSSALDLDPDVRGTLEADIQVQGTVSEPTVTADALATKVLYGEARFPRITMKAERTPDRLQASANIQQTGGGSLAFTFEQPDDQNRNISLEARDFDLGFVTYVVQQTPGAPSALDGTLAGRLSITGPSENPTVAGRLVLKDGFVAMAEPVRRITDLRVVLGVDGGQVKLEARANAGRGDVEIDATAVIDGFTPEKFALVMVADKMPIVAGGAEIITDSRIKVDGVMRGPEEGWKIDVVIDETLARVPEETGGRKLYPTGELEDVVYVDAAGERERVKELAKNEGKAGTAMDIYVKTPDGIRIRGEGNNAIAQVDLHMIVRGEQTRIDGMIRITNGYITLLGRRYQVRKAQVVFDRSAEPDPQLDILLAHRFPQSTLFLGVTGTASEPRLQLSSDPPSFDQAQLLGQVLGEDPGEEKNPGGEGGGIEGAAVGAAGSFVAGKLGGLLEKTIPVDTIKIESGDNAVLSALLVGKWLRDNLFLGYRHRFTPELEESANVAILEYWFLPNWILEGTAGDKADASADVMWIKRW